MQKRQSAILTKNGRSSTPLELDEYLSAEQYRRILALADELNVDLDKASRTLFEVSADALSANGATDLIEYLERLKG